MAPGVHPPTRSLPPPLRWGLGVGGGVLQQLRALKQTESEEQGCCTDSLQSGAQPLLLQQEEKPAQLKSHTPLHCCMSCSAAQAEPVQ